MNDAGDCYYAVIFTAEMADNVLVTQTWYTE